MKELMQQIAASSDFEIKEIEVDRDHIHLMILSQPKLSPAQIVRRLKAESTRLIWLGHPELQKDFWKKQRCLKGTFLYSSLDDQSCNHFITFSIRSNLILV